MMCMVDTGIGDLDAVLAKVREELKARGIDFESACREGDGPKVKVVCVAPDLKCAVEEVSKTARDQVVMVRVDEETLARLDAWVETGAVRSRSEAAAVFIREGMNVRASELEQLRDAIRGVEVAKKRLREKAREVFGGG